MTRTARIAALAAIACCAVPAAAGAHGTDHRSHPGGAPAGIGRCAPNANLLAFDDELNQTTFGGTHVGGLSALSLRGDHARFQVDNEGTTPARFYDARLRLTGNGIHARIQDVVTLERSDGSDYTGATSDGEGLVTLKDGSALISSETEPSIRRFSAAGRQLDSLKIPPRFRIAPAGDATTNLAFEGLGLSPDGRTLWAGMEGPLAGDTPAGDTSARQRFLHYERGRHGKWNLVGSVGYVADPGLAVSEVQVVGDDELLVLERGFVAGVGNTVRVYQASLEGASDVTDEPTLTKAGLVFAGKRLLVDLGDCPSGGATNPGTQADPLLDNVEGMTLGAELPGGRRVLWLETDNNNSTGQVTRIYALSVRLLPEPVLLTRATYDANQLQDGPPSGATGVAHANGVTFPLPGQPVPGISGAVWNGDGTFWGMPDNGFGAKDNSADFLLRVYHSRPHWRTAQGGDGQLELDRYISLRDPDHEIPWPIVNQNTASRLLTGADFDTESIQKDGHGGFWIGDEFGPFLLHVDFGGKLLQAPIPLPGVKSPQNPTLAPGVTPNLAASNGFESMAASPDGATLDPIPEGPLTTDADPTLRVIHAFDPTTGAYTGETWTFHVAAPGLSVGDAQMLDGNRLLFIERDTAEGPAAQIKRLVEVDLDATPQADGSLPRHVMVNLLRIRDPRGVSGTGAFGLGDPFSFPFQSDETIVPIGRSRLLIANDNNYPGNAARRPGHPDDLEAAIIQVPGLY